MRPNRRISKIWRITTEELSAMVECSSSIADVLSMLDIQPVGSNYRRLKQRLDEDEIDYSRLTIRKPDTSCKIPLDRILIKNSKYGNLKRRLYSEGIIENVCDVCGLAGEWNGKPLVMVLDHINGVRDDNRLSNLRMLCPNCNSQQETFAGRNNGKEFREPHYKCINCGKISANRKLCSKKCSSEFRRVFKRPSKDELTDLLKKHILDDIASMCGTTRTTVRRWIKYYDISFRYDKRTKRLYN